MDTHKSIDDCFKYENMIIGEEFRSISGLAEGHNVRIPYKLQNGRYVMVRGTVGKNDGSFVTVSTRYGDYKVHVSNLCYARKR
jgi:hypothetical protein